MELQKSLKVGTLVAAFLVAPEFSVAATDQPCGAPLALSCSQRAADLLTDIQRDNRAVLHQVHARQLNRVAPKVDDMRLRVNQLEGMQADVAPWERQAIGQVAVGVQQVAAASTQGNMEDLAAEAGTFARTVNLEAHAARVYARAEYERPNLGMTGSVDK
jgi:hypothetical protein